MLEGLNRSSLINSEISEEDLDPNVSISLYNGTVVVFT